MASDFATPPPNWTGRIFSVGGGGGGGGGGGLGDLANMSTQAYYQRLRDQQQGQTALEQLAAQLQGQQALAAQQAAARLQEQGMANTFAGQLDAQRAATAMQQLTAQGGIQKDLQSSQLAARMQELLQSQTGAEKLQSSDAASQMQRLQAQLASASQMQGTDINAQMQRLQAQLGNATSMQQTDIAAQMQRLQNTLAQQRYDTDANNLTRQKGDQLAAQTATRGQDVQAGIAGNQLGFEKGKFDKVYGSLQAQMGQTGVEGPPLSPVQVNVPASVFTPGQIDQQVNAARAGTDRTGESQALTANNSLAARGFGSNSGIGMALGQMARGQAMQTGADQEREIRLGSAQANAGQATQAAGLNLQAGIANQDTELKRRNIAAQRQASLISALANLA